MAKIKVLALRRDRNQQNIAHCEFNGMYGDVLAVPQVQAAGVYELKITVKVKDGRLVPMMRVEP